MQGRAVVVLLLAANLVACQGPTEPGIGTLTLTPGELSIERTASVQLNATLDGNAGDVTTTAIWTSSDPLIASVEGGLVSGIRPGQATISALYEGRTGSVVVNVRRRLQIQGTIRIANRTGVFTIRLLIARLNGADIGYLATEESGRAEAEVLIRDGSIFDTSVSPGTHLLSLYVAHAGPSLTYDVATDLHIVDRDSLLQLGALTVPGRSVVLSETINEVVWEMIVPSFP